MVSVINIWPVFKKHFETLKEDTSVEIIISLFIVFPLLGSILLVYFRFFITSDILGSLIAAFSILVGFTINILVVLFGTKRTEIDIRNKLIEHLSYNVLYELVIGLMILSLTIISSVTLSRMSIEILYLLSAAIYFMMFNFLLTLLMISKRIYTLLFMKLRK